MTPEPVDDAFDDLDPWDDDDDDDTLSISSTSSKKSTLAAKKKKKSSSQKSSQDFDEDFFDDLMGDDVGAGEDDDFDLLSKKPGELSHDMTLSICQKMFVYILSEAIIALILIFFYRDCVNTLSISLTSSKKSTCVATVLHKCRTYRAVSVHSSPEILRASSERQ